MIQIAFTLISVVCLTIAMPRLKKRMSHGGYIRILCIVGIMYLLGNLYFTLLSRTPAPRQAIEPIPFATYGNLFDRFSDAQKPSGSMLSILLFGIRPVDEIVLNVILYYPLGYLTAQLLEKRKGIIVVLIGMAVSVSTELAQYAFQLGRCTMDDLINNTLGCLIGVWVWQVQRKRIFEMAKTNARDK